MPCPNSECHSKLQLRFGRNLSALNKTQANLDNAVNFSLKKVFAKKTEMIYPHFPLNRLLFSHIKEQHKDAVVKEVGVFSLNVSK